MTYREKFTTMFSIIQDVPNIEILQIRNTSKEILQPIVQKKFDRLQKKFNVDYYPSMSAFYELLGRINIAWHYKREDDIVVPGEINLVNFTNIFFRQVILYDPTAPEEEIAHIKELKPFDDHPFLGDGVLSAFKIVPSKPEPEIWLFDGSIGGQIFKMDITLEEYFKALLDMRGAIPWQYLFCDIDFSKSPFVIKKQHLQEILETLPMLFPDTDYSPYQERFNQLTN